MKNQEQEFTLKGELIGVIKSDTPLNQVMDIVKNRDAFNWTFITPEGKTIYHKRVLELEIEDFPITVINTEKKSVD